MEEDHRCDEGGSDAKGLVRRMSSHVNDINNVREKFEGNALPTPETKSAKGGGAGCFGGCCLPMPPVEDVDVVLVGAGSMSITVGLMLKQLEPTWKIVCFERLHAVAQESTNGWNNAGTGHSALCEPNYTPKKMDGDKETVDASKAITVNENWQLSRQYWGYLAKEKLITDTNSFINVTPHITYAVGEDQIRWSKARYDVLSKHPLFKGMEYSEDHATMKKWCPVMFQGRDPSERLSMTKVPYGTDMDFGSLASHMSKAFIKLGGDLELFTTVSGLKKDGDKWIVTVSANDLGKGKRQLRSKFVFVGAGGWALLLLQKSGIPEIQGFLGFPISGEFLVCQKKDIAEQHNAKCYGKAAIGAPPMSVPHLDSRIIGGKKMILFGPFAGFSPRYLKTGSLLDLFKAIKYHNLIPAAAAGLQNLDLTVYLIKQLAATKAQKLAQLQVFVPEARSEDWTLCTAGQRVQIMKKDAQKGGVLQFGTEVVSSADGSICGLLGASPGASTAVQVALDVIRTCFKSKMSAYDPKIQKMIPSFGTKLSENPQMAARIHQDTATALNIK